MKSFTEFASTLEKKIRQEIEEEIRFESSSQRSTPAASQIREELPLGYAWLLGQNSFAQSQQDRPLHRGRAAYGVRERPLPPHKLSVDQALAFELFARFGGKLSPSFRLSELKRAWRRVAKTTHPDHGGSSSAFRESQAAYQLLTAVLES